jgi:hypothetical protein
MRRVRVVPSPMRDLDKLRTTHAEIDNLGAAFEEHSKLSAFVRSAFIRVHLRPVKVLRVPVDSPLHWMGRR